MGPRGVPPNDSAVATPAIRLEGVRIAFRLEGGATYEAVAATDLEVRESEFVSIVGPTGCGKSTLLNAVAGFQPPTRGRIMVEGKAIAAPGPDRGMVFQEYALFPWMTVEQNIAFGLDIKGMPGAEKAAVIDRLLEKLHLQDFRHRFPKDLSGGMRQRVAIARVLALDSPILLMDEPFGALDALTRRTLQDELLRIWEEVGKTILFVTHSIEESIYLADRIVVMTYRPGTIKRDVTVTLPRPRDSAAAEFNALKRELAELVMEEQRRFAEDEIHSVTAD